MGELSEQLTTPAWFLFILTYVQDFALTIAAINIAQAIDGRLILSKLADTMLPGRVKVGWYALVIIFYSIFSISLTFLFTWLFNRADQADWVVAVLYAATNVEDAALETILPGLEGTDWQLPALLTLIIAGIGAAVNIRRGQRQVLGIPLPRNLGLVEIKTSRR